MFEEYEDRQTKESKLTKELDVFDAVLQAVSLKKFFQLSDARLLELQV